MGIERNAGNALGNFTIEHINLFSGDRGFDITTMFRTLEITESLTGGLLEGVLSITDSINIYDGLGFTGDETLEISFFSKKQDGSHAKPYSKEFRIKRVEYADAPDTLTRRIINLVFASTAEVNNEFKRISKSYANTGIADIVTDMLGVIGVRDDQMEVESTLYNQDIVIPNLTPLEVIGYLTEIAQSGADNSKGDSNFYFYEDRDKIRFISGSTLTNQDSKVDLTFEATYDIHLFDKILKFVRVRAFNLYEQSRAGAFGANICSHSLLNKRYRQEFLGDTAVKSVFKRMNPERWYINNELADNRAAKYEFRSEDQIYRFLNLGSNGNSAAIRLVNKANMDAKRALAVIGGNTDLTVGDIVNIKIATETDQANLTDSGKWLISGLVHIITPEQYQMSLELISDSDIL